MKKIIIHGMRGTGKTTIGKKLSKILKLDFIDLDEYISEKIGESVGDFVKKNSWGSFRDLENKCLKEVLSKENNLVLSLGGGTIIFPKNQRIILKKSTKIIYIESDLEKIKDRINKDLGNKNRASLTGKSLIEELEEIYNERKDIYNSFYDLKVENNNFLDETVKEIVEKINYGNICIPIVDLENIGEKIKEINNNPKIKFVEIRIDLIEEKENLKEIIKKINKQIIITNRTKKEGGEFFGTSKESIKILEKYLDEVDYVDFELLNGEEIIFLKQKLQKTKLIISYHNFLKTPDLEELKNILENMKKYNPEVYKIALMPRNKKDVEIIYELEKYFQKNYKNKNYIFISMGELGQKTRINTVKNGALLSFGSLDKTSAPGQIDYENLYNLIFN